MSTSPGCIGRRDEVDESEGSATRLFWGVAGDEEADEEDVLVHELDSVCGRAIGAGNRHVFFLGDTEADEPIDASADAAGLWIGAGKAPVVAATRDDVYDEPLDEEVGRTIGDGTYTGSSNSPPVGRR